MSGSHHAKSWDKDVAGTELTYPRKTSVRLNLKVMLIEKIKCVRTQWEVKCCCPRHHTSRSSRLEQAPLMTKIKVIYTVLWSGLGTYLFSTEVELMSQPSTSWTEGRVRITEGLLSGMWESPNFVGGGCHQKKITLKYLGNSVTLADWLIYLAYQHM